MGARNISILNLQALLIACNLTNLMNHCKDKSNKRQWVEKRKKLTISRHLDMIRPLLHKQTGVLN